MLNSILIGKAIYNILKNNDELKSYLDDRIFPIIANEGTSFPFIVYTRTNVTPNYVKGGIYLDGTTVEINIVSTNYVESVDIANVVRNVMESIKRTTVDGLYIDEIKMSSCNEGYYEYAFVQILTFDINIGS